MSQVEFNRRVTIPVTEEQFDLLNRKVRYGLRKHLIARVLDLILEAVDKEGEVVVGFILDGKFKLVRDDT